MKDQLTFRKTSVREVDVMNYHFGTEGPAIINETYNYKVTEIIPVLGQITTHVDMTAENTISKIIIKAKILDLYDCEYKIISCCILKIYTNLL